jgi:DNA repair photolyase
LQVREIECKSLLNKSALADYCINPYVGCEHACRYCYAESYTRRFTRHKEPWGEFVDVKANAAVVLAREIKRKLRGTVFISSLTDPYQPLERKYEVTRQLLEILLRHQFPITIQTKSTLVLRDLDLVRQFREAEVGFTITTLNDEVRKAFEPASSPVEKKLEAIKKLKQEGVKVYVFFGPLLPGISDQNLEGYLTQMAQAKVDYIYVDKLNLKPNLWSSLEDSLKENFTQIHKLWSDVLIGRSDYYQNLKVKIDLICKKLALESRFCY